MLRRCTLRPPITKQQLYAAQPKRRRSFFRRLVSIPGDWYLQIMETYETLNWSLINNTTSIFLGLALNIAYLLTSKVRKIDTSKQNVSLAAASVSPFGIKFCAKNDCAILLRTSMILISLVNAAYFFSRSRKYRFFHTDPLNPPSSKNISLVTIKKRKIMSLISFFTNTVRKFIYIIILLLNWVIYISSGGIISRKLKLPGFFADNDEETVGNYYKNNTIKLESEFSKDRSFIKDNYNSTIKITPDDEAQKNLSSSNSSLFSKMNEEKPIYELKIWEVSSFHRNIFCIFSPLQVLLLHNTVAGNPTILLTLLVVPIMLHKVLEAGVSFAKDKELIFSHVLQEYNSSMVYPRVFVSRRNVRVGEGGNSNVYSEKDESDEDNSDHLDNDFNLNRGSNYTFKKKEFVQGKQVDFQWSHKRNEIHKCKHLENCCCEKSSPINSNSLKNRKSYRTENDYDNDYRRRKEEDDVEGNCSRNNNEQNYRKQTQRSCKSYEPPRNDFYEKSERQRLGHISVKENADSPSSYKDIGRYSLNSHDQRFKNVNFGAIYEEEDSEPSCEHAEMLSPKNSGGDDVKFHWANSFRSDQDHRHCTKIASSPCHEIKQRSARSVCHSRETYNDGSKLLVGEQQSTWVKNSSNGGGMVKQSNSSNNLSDSGTYTPRAENCSPESQEPSNIFQQNQIKSNNSRRKQW